MDPTDTGEAYLTIVNIIIFYSDMMSSCLRMDLQGTGEALSKNSEHNCL